MVLRACALYYLYVCLNGGAHVCLMRVFRTSHMSMNNHFHASPGHLDLVRNVRFCAYHTALLGLGFCELGFVWGQGALVPVVCEVSSIKSTGSSQFWHLKGQFHKITTLKLYYNQETQCTYYPSHTCTSNTTQIFATLAWKRMKSNKIDVKLTVHGAFVNAWTPETMIYRELKGKTLQMQQAHRKGISYSLSPRVQTWAPAVHLLCRTCVGSSKAKIRLTLWPSYPTPWHVCKDSLPNVRDTCSSMFTAAVFTKGRTWSQPHTT